jgi:hypothetical protein
MSFLSGVHFLTDSQCKSHPNTEGQDASDSCLPAYPWNTSKAWDDYTHGNALVDKTCGQMARCVGA